MLKAQPVKDLKSNATRRKLRKHESPDNLRFEDYLDMCQLISGFLKAAHPNERETSAIMTCLLNRYPTLSEMYPNFDEIVGFCLWRNQSYICVESGHWYLQSQLIGHNELSYLLLSSTVPIQYAIDFLRVV